MKLFEKYETKIKQGYSTFCCTNGCFCKITFTGVQLTQEFNQSAINSGHRD